MGRGDKRLSPKMKRRKRAQKAKERDKRQREAKHQARKSVAPA